MAKNIVRRVAPTITLDELTLPDYDNGTGDAHYSARENEDKVHTTIGDFYPLVRVNDYFFLEPEIKRFELNANGFLPSIVFNATVKQTTFMSFSLPKDGDLVNVFLRCPIDNFKGIRADFEITNCTSTGGRQDETYNLTITGVLYVPFLHREENYAITGTSIDTLQAIAERLGLGFATNEENTQDEMNWLNPSDTNKKFIQDITKHAYKNDTAFYVSYIDIFYNLTFVNVNEQVIPYAEPLPGIETIITSSDRNDTKRYSHNETPIIFSNDAIKKMTNFYIEQYNIVNNAATINRRNGYVKRVNFFEHNNLSNWEFDIEATITEGAEQDKILLKGRPGDSTYLQEIKRKYMGVQYSSPVYGAHENYKFAVFQNYMNNQELDKLNLIFVVQSMNFNTYRYMNIPCVFTSSENQNKVIRLNKIDSPNREPLDVKLANDKFYTGNYLIKSYRIIYTPKSGFKQEYLVTRREWDVPA